MGKQETHQKVATVQWQWVETNVHLSRQDGDMGHLSSFVNENTRYVHSFISFYLSTLNNVLLCLESPDSTHIKLRIKNN